ncbi:unnamed protein product [Vitrella brassicaformis CCMP3155]|uniref:Calcium-dependent protein kinase 1 n=2 Tax=Vitrella brassicaformis TaxID=1169539 RepID=A0A0G4FGX0_VITBC|nr:unnamed protein product [Vitrella brassicaformis CCMP3155]|eukprot:CEM12751.1 unnamed protein product [Vitrella brassicaformis CCMP3155]
MWCTGPLPTFSNAAIVKESRASSRELKLALEADLCSSFEAGAALHSSAGPSSSVHLFAGVMGNCNNTGSSSEPPAVSHPSASNGQPKEVKKEDVTHEHNARAASLSRPEHVVTAASSHEDLKVGKGMFVSGRTGKITDSYRMGEKLGDGAFGCVRKAVHRETNQVRAVKTISKQAVAKGDEKEKLFAEVAALKELDHPNIMNLFEFYEDQKHYHLVSELLTGGELFDKVIEMNHFSEAMAAESIAQVLSGVVYCHKRNIVHRDLKPENLLLESKAEGAPIKIIDFGTAKLFPRDNGKGMLMSQKLGTPYYVAPEVLRGRYDEKCDVWSSGVILYILLVGYPPFNGEDDNAILRAVESGKYSTKGSEWRNISKEAKNLLAKMLEYSPSRRVSAEEALSDPWIQKYRSVHISKPTSADLTSSLGRLKQFKSSQRLQQAALTFIISQLATKEEKEKLTETFKHLDANGDGMLSREELLTGYKDIMGDADAAAEEVERILQTVDSDHSGMIDYTEFLVAAMDRRTFLSEKKLEAAFRAFDKDGSGKISKDELAAVFGVGQNIAEDLFEEMIREADKDGDGEVDMDEFKSLFQQLLRSPTIGVAETGQISKVNQHN